MNPWVLRGGWLYVRHPKLYREFLKLGCRVVFIGCGSGHYRGCPKEKENASADGN